MAYASNAKFNVFRYNYIQDLPPEDKCWLKDHTRTWPKLAYEDLVDYLICRKAYDGKGMKSFRSTYAYNYVQSGWLGNVYSCESDGLHFLKALVSPSQPGVGRSDYKAWVAITDDSTVETAHCTCPAGNGRSCSHVAAIMYAVVLAWDNGLCGETCTDKKQAWGQGASKGTLPNLLSEITFEKPSKTVLQGKLRVKSNDIAPKPMQYLDHTDLINSVTNCSVKDLWQCKGTMLYHVMNAPEPTHVDVIEDVFTHGEHSVENTQPIQPPLGCVHCNHVFQQFVYVNDASINSIEESTHGQNSDVWSDSRKIRITSSKAHSIPKSARADPNKFVTNLLYTRFKGCAATKHGQKFEPIARKWFEQKTGKTVMQSGIVICKGEPYLAASPDGVIDPETLLEIKCPTRPLRDLIASGKYDVCLQDGEPTLNPKGKNGYFTQVQLAMYCTQKQLCKFVVWTPDYQVIVDVPINKEFLGGILPRLRSFYFAHILVRVADELHFRRLQLSKNYHMLCSVSGV